MNETENLTLGYREARTLTREHAKTFYFASHFLAREKQDAAYAVYAVCRISDDSVDAAEGFSSEANLARARAGIEAAYAGGPLPTNVWYAFRDTVRRYAIPQLFFEELLDGMGMDLHQNHYVTYSDLYHYCYKVAGVIGLIMLKLFGQRHPAAPEYAVDLGIAMQLTNILRDIREDYQKGRIYLPQEELRAYGVSERDIAAGTLTEGLRALLQFQIARARKHYARAEQGIRMIAGVRSRFVTYAMKDIYAGILDVIERNGYDVFAQRAHVPGRQKVVLALRILLAGRYLRAVPRVGSLRTPYDKRREVCE